MTSNRLLDVAVEVLHDDRWCQGWADPTTWRKRGDRWFVTVRYQPAPQSNHLDVVNAERIRKVRYAAAGVGSAAMVTSPVRIRELDESCPRCGAALAVEERGVMVADLSEPAKWATVRRMCTAGCPLTIDDFPEGA